MSDFEIHENSSENKDNQWKYDAFISYKHGSDGTVAAGLQAVLQSLGKPWWRRRSMAIFRDDTALVPTVELWPSIELALSTSKTFILMASPESAASPWVAKEVEYWLKNRELDRLIVALTDGELAWDQNAHDFVWEKGTPLPTLLKGFFREEPLWIDFREFRGAKPSIGKKNRVFLSRASGIAAVVLDRPKEDLFSEELKQQRLNTTWALSAVAGLIVVAFLAIWQMYEAERQRDIANQQRNAQGRMLARASVSQTHTGDTGTSVELALEALPKAKSPPEIAAPRGVIASLRYALDQDSRLLRLRADDGGIVVSKFSPNGRYIVGISYQGHARVWDGTSGHRIHDLGRHDKARHVDFSPDGTLVAIASDHPKIWDLVTGKLVFELRRKVTGKYKRAETRHVRFSTDGKLLLSSHWDHSVSVWDLATGEQLHNIDGSPWNEDVFERESIFESFETQSKNIVRKIQRAAHYEFGGVGHIKWVPGSSYFVTGGEFDGDSLLRLWDAITGQQIRTFSGIPLGMDQVTDLDVSPLGDKLAASSANNITYIWNIPSGFLSHKLIGHTSSVESVRFSPDGSKIATASQDRTARIWSVQTGMLEATFRGHSRHVWKAIFDHEGRRLLTLSSDTTARIWDIPRKQLVTTLFGHQGTVFDGDFSPTENKLITGSVDGSIRIWKNRIGLPKYKLDPSSSKSSAELTDKSLYRDYDVIVSEAEKYAVIARRSTRRPLLLNIETGQTISRLDRKKATADTFTIGDNIFFTAGDNSFLISPSRLYQSSTGKLLTSLPPVRWSRVVNSGKKILFLEGNLISRVDLRTGERDANDILIEGKIQDIDVLPNGKTIVVATRTSIVTWDFDDHKRLSLQKYPRKTSEMRIAISSKTGHVLTLYADGELHLIDTLRSNLKTPDQALGTKMETATFSQDGRFILALAVDSTIKIWRVDDGRLLTSSIDDRNDSGIHIDALAYSLGRVVGIGVSDTTEKLLRRVHFGRNTLWLVTDNGFVSRFKNNTLEEYLIPLPRDNSGKTISVQRIEKLPESNSFLLRSNQSLGIDGKTIEAYFIWDDSRKKLTSLGASLITFLQKDETMGVFELDPARTISGGKVILPNTSGAIHLYSYLGGEGKQASIELVPAPTEKIDNPEEIQALVRRTVVAHSASSRIATLQREKIRIWDGNVGRPLCEIENKKSATRISLAGRGSILVIQNSDGRFEFRSATNCSIKSVFHTNFAEDESLTNSQADLASDSVERFVNSSQLVLTKSGDVWNIKTGSLIADNVLAVGDRGSILRLTEQKGGESPDLPIFMRETRNLQIFETSSNLVLKEFELEPNLVIKDLNRALVEAGLDGLGEVLDAKERAIALQLAYSGDVIQSARLVDNKQVVLGHSDGTVSFLNTESGKILSADNAHSGPVKGIIRLGSTNLATFGEKGAIFIWSLHNQTLVAKIGKSGDDIRLVVPSRDGSRLAVFLVRENRRVLIILPGPDMRGAQVFDLGEIGDTVTKMEFSLNGDYLVTGWESGRVEVWDGQGSGHIKSLVRLGGSVNGIAVNPKTGHLLIWGSGVDARDNGGLWKSKFASAALQYIDLQSGKSLLDLGSHSKVLSAGFSGGGNLLLLSTEDRAFQAIDVESGLPVFERSVFESVPKVMAINEAHDSVAITFKDGIVRVWNFSDASGSGVGNIDRLVDTAREKQSQFEGQARVTK